MYISLCLFLQISKMHNSMNIKVISYQQTFKLSRFISIGIQNFLSFHFISHIVKSTCNYGFGVPTLKTLTKFQYIRLFSMFKYKQIYPVSTDSYCLCILCRVYCDHNDDCTNDTTISWKCCVSFIQIRVQCLQKLV